MKKVILTTKNVGFPLDDTITKKTRRKPQKLTKITKEIEKNV
jgi:hypothetical protein